MVKEVKAIRKENGDLVIQVPNFGGDDSKEKEVKEDKE